MKSSFLQKFKYFSLIAIFTILLIPQISLAYYSYSNWEVSEMNSDININQDSSVNITETIQADFSLTQEIKHGIFRFIPINYKDKNNQNFSLRFQLVSITDEKGQPYNYEQSTEGNNVFLKIGDPDIYVQGSKKTYLIKYKLDRGINQFADYDEFYWNSTGTEWNNTIQKSTTTVTIPTGSSQEKLKVACFTGTNYSTDKDCTAKIINDHTFQFITTRALSPYSGISIVTGFPKGLIIFPSTITLIIWFLIDNWGYLIPLIVFLYMYYLWHKNGRDPRATRSAIMPEYEAPNGLSPSEIGTLIDDRVDTLDITSAIIDLASRGYLIINEKIDKKLLWNTTSYELEKTTSKETKALKNFEQAIYDGIFTSKEKVNLDDLKYKFFSKIPDIKTKIYEGLVSNKYYTSNPDKIRTKYATFSGGGFIIMIAVFNFLFVLNPAIFIGILISFAIIFGFSFIMPKKSQLGADTYIRILGLEEFIKTAEKDRLKFYEKENIFEKILPYAIALGLADKWAKACEGIFTTSPSWYKSSNPNAFNTWYFLNTLNGFNSNLETNLTSAPRSAAAGGSSGFSSGGGFSGGGFGGGGGGSW